MQWDKSERNTSEKSTFSNLPKLEGEPPQIGGSTVSRSRGLENNFFLLPKPFSENSHTGDSKNVRFFSLEPFLAEKTAVKEKKARFDPFVPPTHFQQQVGWGTRLVADHSHHFGDDDHGQDCEFIMLVILFEKSWKCLQPMT